VKLFFNALDFLDADGVFDVTRLCETSAVITMYFTVKITLEYILLVIFFFWRVFFVDFVCAITVNHLPV